MNYKHIFKINNTPLLLLIISVIIDSTNAWSCGIGKVTNTLSFLITLPSDLIGVNNCCEEHDQLIETINIAREEADRVFCSCLENNSNWWVRNVVKPVFCKSVELYSDWFLREKENENQFRRFKFQWD